MASYKEKDEIRFRAWRTDDKEYSYDVQSEVDADSYFGSLGYGYPLEQSTGFKDDNNKLVHKHDIIEIYLQDEYTQLNGKYVVVKDNAEWLLINTKVYSMYNDEKNIKWEDVYSLPSVAFNADEFHLIGNINENPELLK